MAAKDKKTGERKSPSATEAKARVRPRGRGGKNLTADQGRILNQAKGELRKLFDRSPA